MVALLPSLAILIFNAGSLRQARQVEIHELALRNTELAAVELDAILSGVEGILAAVSRAPAVRSLNPERCNDYLEEVMTDLPQLNALAAIDASGTMQCRSAPFNQGANYLGLSFVDGALAGQEPAIGEYLVSPNDQRAVLPLGFPLRDDLGQIIGVVATGLDLQWLGDRMRERNFGDDSSIAIADRDGTVLARDPEPERFVGTQLTEQSMALLNADQPGTTEVESVDGARRVQGYFPITSTPNGLYVTSGISQDEAFAAIDVATGWNLALALIGALAAFATTGLLGQGLFKEPVNRLLSTVSAWRGGNTAARTGMRRGQSEISEVGVAIDEFLDELDRSREMSRKAEQHRGLLVRELDHRVKNMLATVQALASQTFRSQDRRGDVESFHQRLSALAQTHSILVSEQWRRANIVDTIKAGIDLFDGSNGRISIDGPSLDITPRAALTLSMAVHELCTNAVKYGALSTPEGRVQIAWRVQETDDLFLFDWTESGGPLVTPPTRQGFGSRMIERALAAEMSGTAQLDYAPTGLVCRVRAKASVVLWSGADQTGDLVAP